MALLSALLLCHGFHCKPTRGHIHRTWAAAFVMKVTSLAYFCMSTMICLLWAYVPVQKALQKLLFSAEKVSPSSLIGCLQITLALYKYSTVWELIVGFGYHFLNKTLTSDQGHLTTVTMLNRSQVLLWSDGYSIFLNVVDGSHISKITCTVSRYWMGRVYFMRIRWYEAFSIGMQGIRMFIFACQNLMDSGLVLTPCFCVRVNP